VNVQAYGSYIKNFILIFIPLFFLFSILAAAFWFHEKKSQQMLLLSAEKQHIEVLRRIANDDIKTIISDLFLLSLNPKLQQFIETDKPDNRLALAAVFREFSKSTTIYDQIRFIDNTGMERVRVNYNNGRPYVVADSELQNKSRRYYFADTYKLDPGRVLVSPFDLNVEHGQVEQPLKPMIRFGTPIVDRTGLKRGIILLNYLGKSLIENLNQLSDNSIGTFMLVNAQGYWLKAVDPEDEWGFMFAGRDKITLAHRDREAWQLIATHDEGRFRSDQGLYTYATIWPLNRNMLSSTGSSNAFQPSAADLAGRELYWKVVSFISEKKLQDHAEALLLKWMPWVGFAMLLMVAVSIGFSVVSVQRKRAAEERLYREKLQAVLEMAGGVCHELNQPMQAISGYCELLMLKRQANNPDNDIIAKIKSHIDRLGALTKKLAQITKYETTDYVDGKIVDIEKSARPLGDADKDVNA